MSFRKWTTAGGLSLNKIDKWYQPVNQEVAGSSPAAPKPLLTIRREGVSTASVAKSPFAARGSLVSGREWRTPTPRAVRCITSVWQGRDPDAPESHHQSLR
jgi:hypothetical protein